MYINQTIKDGSKDKKIESIYFDSPDTALIDKMLSKDPIISKNALLWNQSKAANYKLKN